MGGYTPSNSRPSAPYRPPELTPREIEQRRLARIEEARREGERRQRLAEVESLYTSLYRSSLFKHYVGSLRDQRWQSLQETAKCKALQALDNSSSSPQTLKLSLLRNLDAVLFGSQLCPASTRQKLSDHASTPNRTDALWQSVKEEAAKKMWGMFTLEDQALFQHRAVAGSSMLGVGVSTRKSSHHRSDNVSIDEADEQELQRQLAILASKDLTVWSWFKQATEGNIFRQQMRDESVLSLLVAVCDPAQLYAEDSFSNCALRCLPFEIVHLIVDMCDVVLLANEGHKNWASFQKQEMQLKVPSDATSLSDIHTSLPDGSRATVRIPKDCFPNDTFSVEYVTIVPRSPVLSESKWDLGSQVTEVKRCIQQLQLEKERIEMDAKAAKAAKEERAEMCAIEGQANALVQSVHKLSHDVDKFGVLKLRACCETLPIEGNDILFVPRVLRQSGCCATRSWRMQRMKLLDASLEMLQPAKAPEFPSTILLLNAGIVAKGSYVHMEIGRAHV